MESRKVTSDRSRTIYDEPSRSTSTSRSWSNGEVYTSISPATATTAVSSWSCGP